MKFDLTKNIQLEPPCQKIYFWARIAAYALFLGGIFGLAHLVLFPSQSFSYDASAANPRINTIYSVSSDKAASFDIFSAENFSNARIKIIFEASLPKNQQERLSVSRTYEAFTYPQAGTLAGFPEGCLVKNSGRYFLVSDGMLRKFSSFKLAEALGYDEESFFEASQEELNYNPKGSDISDSRNYPDGALLAADGTYYQVADQNLKPFVSEKAYLTHYGKAQAVSASKDFISNYAVSNEQIGFASGTLLSFDNAIFVVSGNNIFAIDNPATFISLGYDWDSVIPASGDEIGIYERTNQLFTISQPHPDGTIFFDKDSGKYYLIANGSKQEIRGSAVIKAYLNRSPIAASGRSLMDEQSCELKKTAGSDNSYECSVPVIKLINLSGNAYEFKISGMPAGNVLKIDAVFSREINWSNMRDSLSSIKNKILLNYGYAPPR